VTAPAVCTSTLRARGRNDGPASLKVLWEGRSQGGADALQRGRDGRAIVTWATSKSLYRGSITDDTGTCTAGNYAGRRLRPHRRSDAGALVLAS
jgi:hypothetical protein